MKVINENKRLLFTLKEKTSGPLVVAPEELILVEESLKQATGGSDFDSVLAVGNSTDKEFYNEFLFDEGGQYIEIKAGVFNEDINGMLVPFNGSKIKQAYGGQYEDFKLGFGIIEGGMGIIAKHTQINEEGEIYGMYFGFLLPDDMPNPSYPQPDFHTLATTYHVEKSNSYSLEETLTGGFWIDGKPIYRKVINLNSVGGATAAFNLTSFDIDNVISINGTANTGTEILSLNYSKSDGDVSQTNCFIVADGVEFTLYCQYSRYTTATQVKTILDCSFVAIIEYTKTTD